MIFFFSFSKLTVNFIAKVSSISPCAYSLLNWLEKTFCLFDCLFDQAAKA